MPYIDIPGDNHRFRVSKRDQI